MTMNRTARLVTASTTLALVAGGGVALAGSATAATEKQGTCAGSVRYEFEVEKDNGVFEIDAELDSDQADQRWRVKLFHDGNRVMSKVKTTDRDGEFDIERHRGNTAGNDRFTLRARNLANDRLCTVTIVKR